MPRYELLHLLTSRLRRAPLPIRVRALVQASAPALSLALAALLGMVAVQPAFAQVPVFPQAFYGEVTAAGKPAPAGTVIEARGTGVRTGIPFNPLVTTEAGKYGGPGTFDPKLLVQGTVVEDAAVEFYVNGDKAQVAEARGEWRDSYPFKSDAVVLLNIRVQTALAGAPPTTSTWTPAPVPPTATSRPPETAVPTATHRPQQVTAPAAVDTEMPPAATATESPPISGPSPTGSAPAMVTMPETAEASSARLPPTLTQTPASVAATEAPTHPEVAAVSSPTATPDASPSPAVVSLTAGTARPTSAPILALGQTLQAAADPASVQDMSRGLILGSGLALLVAAVATGAVFVLLQRRVP